MELQYCPKCGKKITEEDERNGDTRLFENGIYHKLCLKKLIDTEHKEFHKKIKWTGLWKKPRFIVAWWTPYFWIIMGLFYMIGSAVSLFFFKNIAIFNLAELRHFGTTDPPLVAYLTVSTIVSMFMIVYGIYLFNHTEPND